MANYQDLTAAVESYIARTKQVEAALRELLVGLTQALVRAGVPDEYVNWKEPEESDDAFADRVEERRRLNPRSALRRVDDWHYAASLGVLAHAPSGMMVCVQDLELYVDSSDLYTITAEGRQQAYAEIMGPRLRDPAALDAVASDILAGIAAQFRS